MRIETQDRSLQVLPHHFHRDSFGSIGPPVAIILRSICPSNGADKGAECHLGGVRRKEVGIRQSNA